MGRVQSGSRVHRAAEFEGHDAALRALAPVAREFVARRPLLAADVLTIFGLLELRRGDPTCAQQCADLIVAAILPIYIQLVCELAGRTDASIEERMQLHAAEMIRIPPQQRLADRNAVAPDLVAAAVARWC